jgi:transcriptional regulator with XRE-family HTH domain
VSTLQTLFGQRLQSLRRQKNLTQEHLAEDTEVSVDLISNIERGVNAPSFKTLEKLSTVLHVSPCELFDFEKEKGIKGRST